MQLPIIIQARMSSKRLPGKVLCKIGSMEMLLWVIKRLRNSVNMSELIVATSKEKEDDAVVEFCHYHSINVFRGPLENVAQRYAMILSEKKWNAFVRICADSPFIDPNVIDIAISLFSKGDYALLSNTIKRTYPKGQSVEIFKSSIFLESINNFSMPAENEHIASYFYKNSNNYNLYSLELDMDYSNINMCVDTTEDLAKISQIISMYGQKEIFNSGFVELAEYFKSI